MGRCTLTSKWSAVLLLFAGGFLSRGTSFAAAPDSAVKAVLLFHLTQFVNWPPWSDTTSFKIGILGPDPFGEALDAAVKDESVAGHAIVVRRANAMTDLSDCQLVYISPAMSESPAKGLAFLKGKAVLVVGESEEFLKEGGMVKFTPTPGHKIRLEVNLDNVQNTSLKISSQLLRVCIVKGGSK